MLPLLLLLAQTSPVPAQSNVLVEDDFSGSAGAPPDAAKFDWSGQVGLSGAGQLTLSTDTANTSWVKSKAAVAVSPGQTLLANFTLYAYAEGTSPGTVYGDKQPRGLRAGADANNVVEFYSASRTTVGLRVRRNGSETVGSYSLPSGVDSMHQYEIALTTTSAVFRVDGTLAGTITSNIPTNSLNFHAVTFDGYFGNVPVSVDSMKLSLINAGVPPSVVSQPTDQSVAAGSSAEFTVTATGTEPLAYQWFFNSVSIPDATNSSLTLTNVDCANKGNYQVTITNACGSVTGSVATLDIYNRAPSAAPGGPYTNVLGSPLSLTGSGSSDPDAGCGDSIAEYAWDLNLDGVWDAYGATPAIAAAALSELFGGQPAGTHTIRLKVTDGNSVTAQVETTLTCLNVLTWGSASAAPATLTNAVAIATGNGQTLALREDGTVVGWDGPALPAGLSNVVAVAGGEAHALALRSNGTVFAWGENGWGQRDVPAGLSNVVAIAVGGNHNLALRSDGTVAAWGMNWEGQCDVPAGLSNVVAVAAGGWYYASHSLALRADGTVRAWGWNGNGQCDVPAGLSNVVAVAAGTAHSLALCMDGTVVAWGWNGYGQCNVPENLTNAVAVQGGYHSLAQKADGTVAAWGYGEQGQCNVPAWLSNVVGVAAGGYHSAALVGVGRPFLPPLVNQISTSVGGTVFLRAYPTGKLPMSCQWQKNGVVLPGATNALLAIANAAFINGGSYQLVVTNSSGSVTSQAVVVDIIQGFSPATDFTFVTNGSSIAITGYTGAGGSVSIPSSINGLPVTSIAGAVFGEQHWVNVTDLTIPDSVTSIGENAFRQCASLTNVTMGNSVASIAGWAFSWSGLTTITIPDSVASIGVGAFYSCTSLTNVTMSTNVTYIGDYGFYSCTGLRSITIPDGVTNICNSTFAYCSSLTSITILDSVTNIGQEAFRSCTSLMSITIPDGVTRIADRTFDSCTSLTDIMIPNGVTNIGYGAFLYCSSLAHLAVPDGVTGIGDSAFSHCTSLTSIVIPDGVTRIGDGTFAYCTSLATVAIPNSVISIGRYVFDSCTGLTSLTIPGSVTSIGNETFYYCSSLTGLYFCGDAPSLGPNNFIGVNNVTVYYLPGGSGWSVPLDGHTPVLWNPQAQTDDASFGVQANGFGFNITGTAGIPIVIEACTNLSGGTWVPLQTTTLTGGLFEFRDPQWANFPGRFYRIRSP